MGAQSTGAITGGAAGITITMGSQTATPTQTSTQQTIQVKDIQINPKLTVDESKTINAGTSNTGNIN
jgi:hypothetical protein